MLKKNQFALCIPLTGKTTEELLEEMDMAMADQPDFIEWRRDYCVGLDEAGERLVLEKLKACGAEIIFTCRSEVEGGAGALDDEARLASIRRCAALQAADYIDIELESDPEFFEKAVAAIKKERCGLLLSHHCFEDAYTMEETVEYLRRMEVAGADVLKLAVTPQNLEALQREIIAAQNYGLASEKPLIMVAMGELGKSMRILPELFGGSLTYAKGMRSTAPGQLSASEIRSARSFMGVADA